MLMQQRISTLDWVKQQYQIQQLLDFLLVNQVVGLILLVLEMDILQLVLQIMLKLKKNFVSQIVAELVLELTFHYRELIYLMVQHLSLIHI